MRKMAGHDEEDGCATSGGEVCRAHREVHEKVANLNQLGFACASTDPVLESFKPDFIQVREAWTISREHTRDKGRRDQRCGRFRGTAGGMWIKCIRRIDCFEDYVL